MSDGFEFRHSTRLVFGRGRVDEVGALAKAHGATRVLVVTDQGLVEAGHAERVRRSLEAARLAVAVFDRVRENPTTADVDACVESARAHEPDLIVGLGGGSSLDCAKGCNFLHTNGGRMQDYWGRGKATRPMLPLFAVPTTAGTGSETQSYALIADEVTHQKMACGDPKALPVAAVLDPELAVSQPRRVMACAGLDSIAHAVETGVTKARNPMSRLFSREAFRLSRANLPRVLADPGDLDAQGHMLLAAALAGTAIEHSMLGAAHSMANPLTATFGIAHGQAVGMMLPHVVRFNGADPGAAEGYADLALAGGLVSANGRTGEPVETLARCLHELLGAAEMPRSLSACGVDPDAIPDLAETAARQWTAQFNPREVGEAEFDALYRQALGES